MPPNEPFRITPNPVFGIVLGATLKLASLSRRRSLRESWRFFFLPSFAKAFEWAAFVALRGTSTELM